MIKEAVQNKPRLYPEAAFPFIGSTNLRARLKPMRTPDDRNWRYIIFALEHCTGPFPFNAITCDRDNSNLRPEKDEDLSDDQKKPAFPVKPASDKDSTDGELQSDNEPSNNVQSAVVTLPEERFGALVFGVNYPGRLTTMTLSPCSYQFDSSTDTKKIIH